LNSSKTALLIDSGCDLSNELISRYDIKVARLTIIYPEKVYADGQDIEPETVYERFPGTIPKTSLPGIQDVLDILHSIREEGYENVIGITISSGLSGTFNAIRLAFEEQTQLKTFAFDTKNISIGSGIYAVWAAQKLEEGWSFEDTVRGLENKIHDSKLFYYMDTLDYLAKGGRITPSIAIVGKILHLKPIISCNDDGIYYTVAKIRGAAKGLSKLLELEVQAASEMKGTIWASVMSGGTSTDPTGRLKEQVLSARKMLLEKLPNVKIVLEKQITASMAIHTGPGLIGISLFAAD